MNHFFTRSKTLTLPILLIFAIQILGLICSSCVLADQTRKTDPNNADFYVRITRNDIGKKQPQTMETAIVTFSNGKTGPEKVTVDLVSAIHIGDKEYYEELNKKFDSYDVVLYEQVIADDEIDERFEADLKQMGMISMFQKGMTNALNLVHQLEHIDYKKEHFVHADMKLSEFLERAQIRGDLQNLLMRANTLGNEEDQDMPIFEGKMVALLFSKDPSLSLKRLFAEYMDVMLPEIDKVFSGEDGSAIITDRNAVCLKRLEEQIKKGKNKIAIFYGSAHNPEFAVSLENDFNLKYDNKRVWVIAWDMTKDKSARK